jgi:hypothetical protein
VWEGPAGRGEGQKREGGEGAQVVVEDLDLGQVSWLDISPFMRS